jgi:hypothetical protein
MAVVTAAAPDELDAALRADLSRRSMQAPAADRPPGHAMTAPDGVERFEDLRATWPQAYYTVSDGWFYGSLRDEDPVVRAADLGSLADALLGREQES